jgi:hypothetical protein
MATQATDPVPEWWDDELEGLLKQCVAVIGEDATDDMVVRLTDHHQSHIDVEDERLRDALVPTLVDAIKAECRRLLTPH